MLHVLIKALLVDVVVALQKDDALPAMMEIFQAHSTVLFESLLDTDMAVLNRHFVTAIAHITMKAGISATHLADAALVAVIYAFLFAKIVVEDTYIAVVLREWYIAAYTNR